MFRGTSSLNLDSKGRLAIPSRYRPRLEEMSESNIVMTLNPLDRSIWVYPLSEWEIIEVKLQQLSDFDKGARRTKQVMLGGAEEGHLDSHGRVRIPVNLQKHAKLEKQVILLGQGNKFELWDETTWNTQQDEWLASLDDTDSEPSEALKQLSL